MNRNADKKPWYIYVLAVAIGLTGAFSDELARYNLIPPIVISIFVAGFAVLLWTGIKEWKKSDQEILCAFNQFQLSAQENRKNGNLSVVQAILGFAAFIVIVFLKISGVSFPAIAIIGIMAASVWLSPVVANRLKKRNPQETAPKKDPWITGREIAAFLVGLIPSVFMCFFIGVGFYHGVWWFTTLPGLIFLFLSSRPLVAAVRTVIRRAHCDDETHVRKGKETDPWDRPDTDPERYRRK